MSRLKGKVAVVTGGGGSGIGHGISMVLAREGAHVVIVELDFDSAEVVRLSIERDGGKATVMHADISRSDDVRSLTDRVVREHERIDILVNSAGVGLVRPLAEVTEEEYDRISAIDLRGVWLCCKYAIPHMQKQKRGSIINIASVHAGATIPLFSVYAGMKAGVAGLTRGIAVEYGPDGIRANTVSPGLVDGRQTREIIGRLTSDVEGWFRDYERRHQAMPGLIQPEDVGQMVAFLASEESRMVTGAEIPVDAGTWAMLISRD